MSDITLEPVYPQIFISLTQSGKVSQQSLVCSVCSKPSNQSVILSFEEVATDPKSDNEFNDGIVDTEIYICKDCLHRLLELCG